MSPTGVHPTGEDEELSMLTWMSRHCRTDTQKVAVFPVPDWDLNTRERSKSENVCMCVCWGRMKRRGDSAVALLCDDVPAFDDLFDGSLLNRRGLLETCSMGGEWLL